jgi:hypothetical protein
MGAEERHALFIVALLLTMRKTPEDTGGAATCGCLICAILGAKWRLGGVDAADAVGIWPLCAFGGRLTFSPFAGSTSDPQGAFPRFPRYVAPQLACAWSSTMALSAAGCSVGKCTWPWPSVPLSAPAKATRSATRPLAAWHACAPSRHAVPRAQKGKERGVGDVLLALYTQGYLPPRSRMPTAQSSHMNGSWLRANHCRGATHHFSASRCVLPRTTHFAPSLPRLANLLPFSGAQVEMAEFSPGGGPSRRNEQRKRARQRRSEERRLSQGSASGDSAFNNAQRRVSLSCSLSLVSQRVTYCSYCRMALCLERRGPRRRVNGVHRSDRLRKPSSQRT